MNIYVGNLSYGINEDDLREVFEQFGEVASVKVILDRDTGRSKGFGFVEMDDSEQGQSAIDELNGKDLEGRPMKVNEARPREERPRRGGFGGGRGGGYNDRRGGYGGRGGGGYGDRRGGYDN